MRVRLAAALSFGLLAAGLLAGVPASAAPLAVPGASAARQSADVGISAPKSFETGRTPSPVFDISVVNHRSERVSVWLGVLVRPDHPRFQVVLPETEIELGGHETRRLKVKIVLRESAKAGQTAEVKFWVMSRGDSRETELADNVSSTALRIGPPYAASRSGRPGAKPSATPVAISATRVEEAGAVVPTPSFDSPDVALAAEVGAVPGDAQGGGPGSAAGVLGVIAFLLVVTVILAAAGVLRRQWLASVRSGSLIGNAALSFGEYADPDSIDAVHGPGAAGF